MVMLHSDAVCPSCSQLQAVIVTTLSLFLPDTINICSSPGVKNQVSNPYKTSDKIAVQVF
jgi:hypothetical protein